jgi:hypothetical protein
MCLVTGPKAQSGGRGIALLFLDLGAVQHHAPAALPPGRTRYPLYRRLGGPQGQSGRVRKISPPPGFDPRTVQPVASRYADWAIPAPDVEVASLINTKPWLVFLGCWCMHREMVSTQLYRCLYIGRVREATVSSVMSVSASSRMELFDYHWTDFRET